MKWFLIAIIGMHFQLTFANDHDEKEISKDKDSSQLRIEKPSLIGFDLGSFRYPLVGTGVYFGRNIGINLTLGIRYIIEKFDAKDSVADENDSEIDSFEIHEEATELMVKWFPSNSFYMKLGISQRKLTADVKVSRKFSSDSLSASLKSTSIVFSPGLGNIWTFDFGLYLGAEWIAFNVPISNSKDSTTLTSWLGSEQELVDHHDEARKFLRNIDFSTTIGILNFHIGLQF